jgi:hypothetical protein
VDYSIADFSKKIFVERFPLGILITIVVTVVAVNMQSGLSDILKMIGKIAGESMLILLCFDIAIFLVAKFRRR